MGDLARINSTPNNSKRHAKKAKVSYNNTIEAKRKWMQWIIQETIHQIAWEQESKEKVEKLKVLPTNATRIRIRGGDGLN